MVLLKRSVIVAGLIVIAASCGGQKHPIKVTVDPSFDGSIDKIAVFPFASSISQTIDPDGTAPRLMNELFLSELDNRDDYAFTSPSSLEYALNGAGLTEEAANFIDGWRKHKQADTAFLAHLADLLQIDGVLVGVVELWQKDEVDVRETSAPATYVGATITILDVKDGSIFFQASDENFIEGARSENRDQTLVRSGAGGLYNDPGARVYAAPEYEEVAVLVARSLAGSIPIR